MIPALFQSDLHIHTELCGHASGMPMAYAQQADRLGLKEIGFADHMPVCGRFPHIHAMTVEEMDDYVQAVESVRKAFPDMTVLLGIEADIYPDFEHHLREMRRRFPIDYVIGSVHYVFDQFLFDPHPPSDLDAAAFIAEYASLIKSAVDTGELDILGHADGLKWLFPGRLPAIESALKPAVETMAASGTALELNSSGIRKKPGKAYPERSLLACALESGVAITLGSDAHLPGQVGMNYSDLTGCLKALGVTWQHEHVSGFTVYRVSEPAGQEW